MKKNDIMAELQRSNRCWEKGKQELSRNIAMMISNAYNNMSQSKVTFLQNMGPFLWDIRQTQYSTIRIFSSIQSRWWGSYSGHRPWTLLSATPPKTHLICSWPKAQEQLDYAVNTMIWITQASSPVSKELKWRFWEWADLIEEQT